MSSQIRKFIGSLHKLLGNYSINIVKFLRRNQPFLADPVGASCYHMDADVTRVRAPMRKECPLVVYLGVPLMTWANLGEVSYDGLCLR